MSKAITAIAISVGLGVVAFFIYKAFVAQQNAVKAGNSGIGTQIGQGLTGLGNFLGNV